MPKRAHGDPRHINVAHIVCANCDHSATFVLEDGHTSRTDELAPRCVCTYCTLRCATVSLVSHSWPNDKEYLRRLDKLPPPSGTGPAAAQRQQRAQRWKALLIAIRKRARPAQQRIQPAAFRPLGHRW